MNKQDFTFIFFGTSRFSVSILEILKDRGFIPKLVVTVEDKPQGRGLILTPPPTKVWAEIHRIPVFQSKTLRDPSVEEMLRRENADVFVVAAYGKLIPKNIFELPPRQTINVHPSLLPRLRGASPIQSAILFEEETGTTIMQIAEEMDQGGIIAQEKVDVPEWPPRFEVLEGLLAKKSGELLVNVLPKWVNAEIVPIPQDEDRATFCKKITKEDGLIDLADDAEKNLRKVRALSDWPSAYTFFKTKGGKEIRLIIKDAEIVEGVFSPTRVVPEGKKEMDWQDFLRGNQ